MRTAYRYNINPVQRKPRDYIHELVVVVVVAVAVVSPGFGCDEKNGASAINPLEKVA